MSKSYLMNTSFHMPAPLERRFVEWVKTKFIPEALNSGLFSGEMFCKLLIQVEEGTVSYAVHFLASDIEKVRKWNDCEAARLKSDFPPQSLLHFTTFMEEVEWQQ